MTECDRNNGETTGRDSAGRFTAGNPGRPQGARHRATRAVLALLDGEAEALTRQAVAMALDGDGAALRLCLERIAPPRRDAPVTFALPPMQSARDAAQAAGAMLRRAGERWRHVPSEPGEALGAFMARAET